MQGDHDLNLVSALDELHTCTQYIFINMYICIVSKSVYICIQTYQVKQITILILTVLVVELGLAYIVLPQNRTLNMYIELICILGM